MNGSRVIKIVIALLFTGQIYIPAWAQWPTNADSNMVISNQSGEQTIPKVAVTSDGGCYISWYNNSSGNYDMYLQRLDNSGIPQWRDNGILISGHQQSSWLTDYDMTVDNEDNAIVTFNDIRAGGDWDIYAYRISPVGDFLWGEDGLVISDNSAFEADPKVIVTTSGNMVFTWQEEDTVCLRKVNASGIDMWEPPIKQFYSEYGLTYPRITVAPDDGVILQYLMALSGGWWPPKNLYACKFNADGNSVWPDDTVAVSVAGGFGPQMRPNIIADGSGGAYSFWYDSRDGADLHAYAQHINTDGSIAWTDNGVLLSTASGEMQSNPEIAFWGSTADPMFFFQTMNMSQTLDGIRGQRVDATGNRLWREEGAVLMPLASPSLSSIGAQPLADGAIIAYKQSPDDVNSCLVKAIRVDVSGDPVWQESPLMMSSMLSTKGYLETVINGQEQVIAVWQDKRYDSSGDIYLQNINSDGSLGPYVVDVNDDKIPIPYGYTLLQNYPNPFNAETSISYALGESGNVNLTVYNISGKLVDTLVDENQNTGTYTINWDASVYACGIYFYKLTANDKTMTKRMMLLK